MASGVQYVSCSRVRACCVCVRVCRLHKALERLLWQCHDKPSSSTARAFLQHSAHLPRTQPAQIWRSVTCV